MSDQNPLEGKYKTMNMGWKYYLIFTSWLFLCLISFYLGIGLVEWDKNPESPSQPDSFERVSVKEAEIPNPLNFRFQNLLEEIFSEGGSSLQEEGEPTEKRSENIEPYPPPSKPILASTWFSDYETMKKVVHLYDEIHPFIYSMKGGLSNTGELTHTWSSTQKKERIEELRKLNPKVKIIPTIFRWENPREKISENIGMNGRTDIRDKHIQIILHEIETYGYDGIDIDYEGMGCEKKEKFEEFILLLSRELKKRGKLLSIAVHPKTPAPKPRFSLCKASGKKILLDYNENWRGPMTHDYEFLAKYADRLKIMAYELHPRKYHNPGPGPQAPNTWLKEIIRYSRKRVPPEKLFMAIPTYGYDWALNCKSPAKSVYYSDVLRIKSMNPAIYQPTDINAILTNNNSRNWVNLSKFSWVHQNKVYEDPSLWYSQGGCDRVAFYMNRKAFEEKMNLLRRYEIGGFSFWQLISDNDPEINDYLQLLMTNQLPPVEIAYDLEEEDEENKSEKQGQDQTKKNLENKELTSRNNSEVPNLRSPDATL